MTTNNQATNKTTANKNTTTINLIADAIRSATTSRGELGRLCKENAKTKQGRDRIASACNILLNEYRTIQSKVKHFESTEAYLLALDARIAAKATKGAKTEKNNFLSWKCGHAKNKLAFYHIITVALKDCTTSAVPNGFKPVLNKDTDYKIAIEQNAVTKKVVNNPPKLTENASSSNTDSEPKTAASSTSEKTTIKVLSPIDKALEALEALNDADLNTLASAMIHGSNDALKRLSSAVIKIREQEKTNKAQSSAIEVELVELQLKADKQKVNVKLAKDKKLTAKTIASRESALKATNGKIADLMNSQKSMSFEARI